jgi:uncharacterized protein YndB with AHSA1/START domain
VTDPERPDRVEHRMERTYEVAATPAQVWDAIATAEGISAWMVPTRLEPKVGGEVSFDLGDVRSTGVVTDYTPNQRFAYEEPWPQVTGEMLTWLTEKVGTEAVDPVAGPDLSTVSPIATEFLIEAASGGSCVVRVVSSAYGNGAEWENEFFTEMVTGWGELLDNLATHLGGQGAPR